MESPPVIESPPGRPSWWLTVVLPGAAAIAVGVVLFLFNPSQYGFYPRCLLYTHTGIYCPGCGCLRALHQLSHGHILTALHDNVLLILSLPYFAFFALRCVQLWMRGARLPQIRLSPRGVTTLVIVLSIFTVLRNIRCAPFTWLAPLG